MGSGLATSDAMYLNLSEPCNQPLPSGQPSLEITSVNFDAVGAFSANPNGEWIDITNTGPKDVDLRDWRIKYKTGTFYDFDESVIISSGDSIRVFMGTGTDTGSEIYWGNTGGILSNSAGDVTLQSDVRHSADTFVW